MQDMGNATHSGGVFHVWAGLEAAQGHPAIHIEEKLPSFQQSAFAVVSKMPIKRLTRATRFWVEQARR